MIINFLNFQKNMKIPIMVSDLFFHGGFYFSGIHNSLCRSTGMILEETLIFGSEEDADAFCAFAREEKIGVKKSFRGVAITEDIVTCSLRGFIDWYSEMIDASSEDSNTFSEGEISLFKRQVNLLTRTRAKLDELLAGKEIGDVIYTREMVQKAILSLLTLPQKDAETLGDLPEMNDVWIPIEVMMKDNDLVVESPEGYRLRKKIDPGELHYQNTLVSYEDAYMDAGKSNGALFSANYSIDAECVVTAGPGIYLLDDQDRLFDLLDSLSVDDVSLDLFHENYTPKQQIVRSLLDLISRKNVLSLTEISAGMAKYKSPDTADPGFEIRLSPIMVKLIVTELIKAKILTGPEKKIRIGKGIHGRG